VIIAKVQQYTKSDGFKGWRDILPYYLYTSLWLSHFMRYLSSPM